MKIGFLSHSDLSIYHFRRPIMRALKQNGHEVFAICPQGRYMDEIKKEFKTISCNMPGLNPLRLSENMKKLSQTLEALNLDMIQSSAHKANIFGTFAAKRAKIKIIINLVEGLGRLYTRNDIKTLGLRLGLESLYRVVFEISDACIFVNDSDPNYMLNKNIISPQKIIRIKSVGVDAKEFDPKATGGLELGDKKIILMVARARRDKGIYEFYEAARILSYRDDVKFIFVGGEGDDGLEEKFLKNKNVEWLGWRDDIKNILKSSYIYVLPSYKEGFPKGVLEAMSMEKPCVVSRVSGCVEAIEDGVNGLICEPKSGASLASKINILLNSKKMAKSMGKYGRKMVLSEFDQDIITQKYLNAYEKFIDV